MKKNNCQLSNTNITPVVVYENAKLQKKQIIAENKGWKAGVSCWTNIKNRSRYIGSSVDLGRRISGYFYVDRLKKLPGNKGSIIYKALRKNGYSNFSSFYPPPPGRSPGG